MKDDAWEDIGSSLLSTDTDESLDADVAVGGRDRTTLGERLRASSRLADARRYAREHRLRVASLLGVAGLLVTGTAYLLTRPPPVDPVIRVSVAGSLLQPVPSDGMGYGPAKLVGMYVVRTDVPGDRVQVVGVVGPGLHDGTGSPKEAVPGQPVAVQAGAETDCATPGWLPATAADYKLRLIRTDAYDRLVESDVPLGDSASEWLDAVHTACRRAAAGAVTVRAAVFDAPPGRPTIGATLSLDNENPFPVWVQQQDHGHGTGPETQIGPGESAEVSWTELIEACDWAEGWSPWYQGDDGVTYLPMRLDVEPLVPVAVDDDDPRALALRVDDQVAGDPPSISTCRGAPRTVVDVSDVRRVRSAGTLRWELDLQVHVAAPQVGLGFRHVVPGVVDDPTAWDDGQLVRLPSQVAKSRDGVASVRVTYAISSCDDAQFITPPGLYVTAIRGDRRYPRWITLGDRALLDAIRVACDGRPAQQAASENGWPASEARG